MMTIYRCECGHKNLDHERSEGSRCSFGGCPCTISIERVNQDGREEQIPTLPAFDHASGKWARSPEWA